MFQSLKESFRSTMWEAMGKLDHIIPADYEYPIVELVYQDLPSLAFPIDTGNYHKRARVVLSTITERIKLGGDPTYLQSQAWRLVVKIVESGNQDLARALDLELENLYV